MKTKNCKKCGKFISKSKHNPKKCFCNTSCSASYNNRGVVHNFVTGEHSRKSCFNCGTTVFSKKFCSNKCQQEFQYNNYIKRWLDGLEDGDRGGVSVSNYIRRWIKETRGEKCEWCGWAEVNKITEKIPVEIDHIDGNSKNTRPENIRLLCPNCHSLTDTHGILNKGKGRRYKYIKIPQA